MAAAKADYVAKGADTSNKYYGFIAKARKGLS